MNNHDSHKHKKHEHIEADTPSQDLPRDRRFGREISFGIQQTLACWATDFIDPYVGKWYQNKYGNKEHEVTSAHTWGGEIAGDSAALFFYLGVKRLFTAPIDAITNATRKMLDGPLARMGKKSLKEWKREEDVDESDPHYQKKLENYKKFQAENLVDSTIIASSSTIINVGAQRYLGNKQGLGLILASKLIGAGLTMGAMLGLRTALPTATATLDDELSGRYFSKVAHGMQKFFGVKGDEKKLPPAETQSGETAPAATALLSDSPLIERALERSDQLRRKSVQPSASHAERIVDAKSAEACEVGLSS